MARLVQHDATGPTRIDLAEHEGKPALYVCACGLSQRWPYCDGSHKATQDEEPGIVYRYAGDVRDGERSVVE